MKKMTLEQKYFEARDIYKNQEIGFFEVNGKTYKETKGYNIHNIKNDPNFFKIKKLCKSLHQHETYERIVELQREGCENERNDILTIEKTFSFKPKGMKRVIFEVIYTKESPTNHNFLVFLR